ncbi:hypothetical protein D3C71_235120 [compost metagenome]
MKSTLLPWLQTHKLKTITTDAMGALVFVAGNGERFAIDKDFIDDRWVVVQPTYLEDLN